MPPATLEQLQTDLDLDDQTTELADVFYGACDVSGIGNGRSTEAMVAGCVYLAVRELEQPVSLSDITDATTLEMNTILAAYQEIIGKLSIQLQPEDPIKYVPEFVQRLDEEFDAHLGTPVVERAKEIIDISKGFTSSTAIGVAAGTVYVAADLENKRLTQAEVGEVANVSPDTVRENALAHRAQL
ncbi:hypothetical protein NP511_18085 [Natrinema thermotolerans]|uniref:Transcription factor TFIIB cyclin-like domain-containing protein n=1 Tax=Natrinema thermotolerans TaxID=121872 RepID=A0AAF0PB35_9EURY|nr:hypothetical protein [Natrinema thermotolerans]QCC60267.1 hypothetical protein DVR14_17155 [Natrinema thermotolerans]QCC61178.1 hypothetical protein DVR14_21285 [Natrinema thermotolerans]WMT07286.1 hypothetical protein NP511_18085 [Natrinema thermotolerans]